MATTTRTRADVAETMTEAAQAAAASDDSDAAGPPGKLTGKLTQERVQQAITIYFVVAALGKPTIDEVLTALREYLDIKIHRASLKARLEDLRALGQLSINHSRLDESGAAQTTYSVRGIDAAKAPPVSSLTPALLPHLFESEEAARLKALMMGETQEGEGKTGRQVKYRSFYEFVAVLVTTDPLFGGAPRGGMREQFRIEAAGGVSKLNGTAEVDNTFERDALTGHPMLPSDVVRGWFIKMLYLYGLSDAVAYRIAMENCVFLPRGEAVAEHLPVSRLGQGNAMSKLECFGPGQTLVLRGAVPAIGVCPAEELAYRLAKYAPDPVRGISHGRGGRAGKAALVRFWHWPMSVVGGEAKAAEVPVVLPVRVAAALEAKANGYSPLRAVQDAVREARDMTIMDALAWPLTGVRSAGG